MSRRTWSIQMSASSPGLVIGAFGFTSTLIAKNPDPALFVGCGGLTGVDAAGNGVANTGPSFISSITKTANNGEFLVTFADGFRAVWYSHASVLGPQAGPGDGVQAQTCSAANQGQGHTTPLTMLVTMLNAAGTPTETNARIVRVFVVLKDIGTGA